MKLDTWIRARSPRLSDTEFGRMMADAERGIPAVSQQAVGMWRRGDRMPRPEYLARIAAVTGGEVRASDFGKEQADG
jgi:hypothetical protein